MKYFLLVILLIFSTHYWAEASNISFQNTLDNDQRDIILKELPLSYCYLSYSTATQSKETIKLEKEIDGNHLTAYFDTSMEISNPCNEEDTMDVIPNSILINGDTIRLGIQLNGIDIGDYSLGRFFYGEKRDNNFFVFEMSDSKSSGNSIKYCYIIIPANRVNVSQHIIYQKENNMISDSELKLILNNISQKKEKDNEAM